MLRSLTRVAAATRVVVSVGGGALRRGGVVAHATSRRTWSSHALPVPTTGLCFELTDEQREMQQMARKFTAEYVVVVPCARDRDMY